MNLITKQIIMFSSLSLSSTLLTSLFFWNQFQKLKSENREMSLKIKFLMEELEKSRQIELIQCQNEILQNSSSYMPNSSVFLIIFGLIAVVSITVIVVASSASVFDLVSRQMEYTKDTTFMLTRNMDLYSSEITGKLDVMNTRINKINTLLSRAENLLSSIINNSTHYAPQNYEEAEVLINNALVTTNNINLDNINYLFDIASSL